MKSTFNSNYLIQGIEVLLHEDRILKCYVPLIPYAQQLVQGLLSIGCKTRDDCLVRSDDAFVSSGLPADLTSLFRRFLTMYDYKGKGIKDIPDAAGRTAEEVAALLELMRLPGVKLIRAQLYYHCGLRSLVDFAASDAVSLQAHIAEVIAQDKLPCSTPLPKELRTQIAVAKLFTEYSV